MSVEEAISQYQTDLKKGLTAAEAEKRLKEHGPNELDAEEEKSLWERIIEQFEDVLVRILLASATISFVIALTGKSTVAMRMEPKCRSAICFTAAPLIDTFRRVWTGQAFDRNFRECSISSLLTTVPNCKLFCAVCR